MPYFLIKGGEKLSANAFSTTYIRDCLGRVDEMLFNLPEKFQATAI